MSEIQWQCRQFDDLTAAQLYEILQLRTEVFVLEQDCVYQDMDGCDRGAQHVTGHLDGSLVCYSRLLEKGIKYATPSIGRVLTKQSIRRDGYGKVLMLKTLDYCEQLWPGEDTTISAQQYLEKFYRELGFTTQSEPYLEDGIPHIEMLLSPGKG